MHEMSDDETNSLSDDLLNYTNPRVSTILKWNIRSNIATDNMQKSCLSNLVFIILFTQCKEFKVTYGIVRMKY